MSFPCHIPSRDDRPITTLFINHWTPPTLERRREIDEVLHRNIECPAIDRIVLLAQSTPEHRASVPQSAKLVWVEMDSTIARGRYSDLFQAVNACTTTPWDINIVANSDVFFDETLNLLKPLDLFGVCVALSRWEWKNGQAQSLAGDNSQDCWIFQGPVRPLAEPVDFPMGTFGCDWRIAWILKHNDYVVVNVAHDVRHYHIHDSPYRNNGNMTPGPHVSNLPYRRLVDCHIPWGRHDRGGVLAFSVFGEIPRYNVGAIENAKMAKWIYPDWTVRVYVDDTTPQWTIDQLRTAAAEVVQAPRWPNWQGGPLWRLLAADDPGFLRWGMRDTDSRPSFKERLAVEDWLESGFPVHAVRDHPAHEHPVILGAFDGLRASIPDMAGHIDAWRLAGNPDNYCSDERMIMNRIWPSIQHQTLVHTDFGDRHGRGGVIRPLPSKRAEGLRFIGERIYEDNHHNGEDRDWYVAARWGEPARVATRTDLLKIIPAGSVVAEVGVFQGEFAQQILSTCQPSALHLIDQWSEPSTSWDKAGLNLVTVNDMEALYRDLCARFQDRDDVRLHRGDSVLVLSQMPDHSLDAAYLDTSHFYEATLQELDVLFQKIKPGGWLMGHDYYQGCAVWPAVNEWCYRNHQRVSWVTRLDECPSFAICLKPI